MNVREWALPVYTILMQLAIGALLILWIIRWRAGSSFSPAEMDRIIRNPLLVISITVIVAMVGSHFHLSRPFLSFLAVRNFRSSWLSREIVFTVLFFMALSGTWLLSRYTIHRRRLTAILGWVAIVFGLIVVFCMARIYLLPTQLAWNSSTVIVAFYTTTLLLGSMTMACLLVLDLKFAEIQKADDTAPRAEVIKYSVSWLAGIAVLMMIAAIGITFYQVRYLSQGAPVLQTSLQLLFKLYTPLFIGRLLLLGSAMIWLGYVVHQMRNPTSTVQELLTPIYMSTLLILIGEIIGRFLFYATHVRLGI